MAPDLLSEFRAILTAKRAEIRLPSRGELLIERYSDPIDDAKEQTRRAAVASEFNRLREQMRLIDAALERIADGTYGECPCGDEIPEKRLRAVPWAALCVPCQQEAEIAAKEEAAMDAEGWR